MTNKEWYYTTKECDEKGWSMFLTEEGKKHPKVVKSYYEFMEDEDD